MQHGRGENGNAKSVGALEVIIQCMGVKRRKRASLPKKKQQRRSVLDAGVNPHLKGANAQSEPKSHWIQRQMTAPGPDSVMVWEELGILRESHGNVKSKHAGNKDDTHIHLQINQKKEI